MLKFFRPEIPGFQSKFEAVIRLLPSKRAVISILQSLRLLFPGGPSLRLGDQNQMPVYFLIKSQIGVMTNRKNFQTFKNLSHKKSSLECWKFQKSLRCHGNQDISKVLKIHEHFDSGAVFCYFF